MPIISQFYGIIIVMHYKENERHRLPHIHAQYSDFDAAFDFSGNQLNGNFPVKQRKMVEAWILIHHDELITLWKQIKQGKEIFKINPLQ